MGMISTLWQSCIQPRKQKQKPPQPFQPQQSTRPLPTPPLPEKPKKLVKKISSIRIVESPEPPSPDERALDELESSPKKGSNDEKEPFPECPCLDTKTDTKASSQVKRVTSDSTLMVESLPSIEEDEDEATEAAVEKIRFMDPGQGKKDKTDKEVDAFSTSIIPDLKQQSSPKPKATNNQKSQEIDTRTRSKAILPRRKSLIEIFHILQSNTPGMRFPLFPPPLNQPLLPHNSRLTNPNSRREKSRRG